MSANSNQLIENFNKQIFTSISHCGLVPRKTNKYSHVCSRDKDSLSTVCVNLFFPAKNQFHDTEKWFQEGLDILTRSQANGFFPLTLERSSEQETSKKWIYFENDRSIFEAKLSSIFCSSVVLECDFGKLPKPAKGYNFNSECHWSGGCREFSFSEKIHPSAFKRAFVPKNLIPLFLKSFTQIELIPIDYITEKHVIEIPVKNAENPLTSRNDNSSDFNVFFGKTFRHVAVTLPDYPSHVEKCIRSHFGDLFDYNKLANKDPLVFHIVRLACEEDIPFLNIKDTPDSISPSNFHLKTSTSFPIIRVHYNAGWGNVLCIRGEITGLSLNEEKKDLKDLTWNTDIPLRCIGGNEWILETTRPVEQKFHFKIIKKNDLGEIVWEKDSSEPGGNHTYNPAKKTQTVIPLF